MKLALITDLHFGSRNDNLKVAEHQKRFYDDVFFPFLREMHIEIRRDLVGFCLFTVRLPLHACYISRSANR